MDRDGGCCCGGQCQFRSAPRSNDSISGRASTVVLSLPAGGRSIGSRKSEIDGDGRSTSSSMCPARKLLVVIVVLVRSIRSTTMVTLLTAVRTKKGRIRSKQIDQPSYCTYVKKCATVIHKQIGLDHQLLPDFVVPVRMKKHAAM